MMILSVHYMHHAAKWMSCHTTIVVTKRTHSFIDKQIDRSTDR